MDDAKHAPTLHEIAAMPYSETVEAIRKHYDPAWGKNDNEGEPVKAWRVCFDWTLDGTFDHEVEAATEEDAIEQAREWALDDAYAAHFSICGSPKVTAIKAARGDV